MTKRIIVNVIPEETRMALAEDGLLTEVAVERSDSSHMVGNIYKGRVENVLPGMQAAFINIGIGKNAFLYAGDIFPHKSFNRLVEEDNLTVGAEIMIEIVKDAMGTKGPRATTHFSIPGRYVVVMPSVDYVGISRRIESAEERSRLRKLAEKIRPKGMGVIVRTVAEGHSEEELARDFEYLANLWEALTAKGKKAKAPFLLYRDADLIVRVIRDHVKDDVAEVVIDNAEAHARMVELARFISPDLVKKIHLHKGKTDIFQHYGIEEEWNRLADRRVNLKCGGYLIIEKTEALTVIDVNTGRFTGNSNLADTVFRANMEAAAEIARQLRLRDIGGIIVADFIDMQKDAHKKAVLLELEARLKADNTKTNLLGLTELGLVEMTRKKARQTYEGVLYEPCPCCSGRGIVQSADTLAIAIRRQLRRIAQKRPGAELVVQLHPQIAGCFAEKASLDGLAQELGIELGIEPTEGMQLEVYSILEGKKALARSIEPVRVRRGSARTKEEGRDGLEPDLPELQLEEMAPLLAEKFAMAARPDRISSFEDRLAAMAGMLWEPLIEEDEEADFLPVDETVAKEAAETADRVPKTRKRRRSNKMTMAEAMGVLPDEELRSDAQADSEGGTQQGVATELQSTEEKPKRRRKRKAKAEEVPPSIETEVVAVEEAAELTAEPAKKSKRRRRRKKKTVADVTATEADGEAEEKEAPEELPVSEAAPVEADFDEPDSEVLTEKKKSKRRRRKKKNPGVLAEQTGAILDVGDLASGTDKATEGGREDEPIEEQTTTETENQTPVKKKRRRRKSPRKKAPTEQEPQSEPLD